MNILSKLKSSKPLIIFLVIILLMAIGSGTSKYPLPSRAVVVGMAIDYEEGQVVASAQIITSVSTGGDTPTNDSFVVIVGKGESMGKALADINNNTGTYLSMGHLVAVFVGEDMMLDVALTYESIEHLVHNYKVPENALVVVSQGKAGDMIRKQTVSTQLAAFAVKQMSSEVEKVARGVTTSVLNYRIANNLPVNTLALPYVQIVGKFEDPVDGKTGGVILDMQSTYMVGDSHLIIDKQDTEVYNLVVKNFSRGRMTLGETEYEYEEKNTDIEVSMEEGLRAKITVEIKALADRYYAGYDKPEEENYLQESTTMVEQKIYDLYLRTSALNIDAYGLYSRFFKKYGRSRQEEYSIDKIFSTCKVEVVVNMKIVG